MKKLVLSFLLCLGVLFSNSQNVRVGLNTNLSAASFGYQLLPNTSMSFLEDRLEIGAGPQFKIDGFRLTGGTAYAKFYMLQAADSDSECDGIYNFVSYTYNHNQSFSKKWVGIEEWIYRNTDPGFDFNNVRMSGSQMNIGFGFDTNVDRMRLNFGIAMTCAWIKQMNYKDVELYYYFYSPRRFGLYLEAGLSYNLFQR